MKRSSVYFLGLVLVAAVFASSGQPARPSSPSKTTPDGHAKREEVGSPPTPVVSSAKPGADQSHAPHDDHEYAIRIASLPAKDWADWAAWVGGIGLVVIGTGGVWLALRTVKAIERQATAQMDADRAWVLINTVGNPLNPIYSPERPGYIPGIVFMVEIVGNTPAKIIRESFRCRIVPAMENSQPPKPTLESVPTYPSGQMFEGSAVYPPTYKYNLSVALESGALSAEQFAELRDGKTVLCAYGRIEYLDAFKRKGATQVCTIYNFAFGGVLSAPNGTVLNPPGFRIGGPDGYNMVA